MKHYVHTNLGMVADWTRDLEQPFLIIVPSRQEAEVLSVNLETAHGNTTALLPSWEISPDHPEMPDPPLQEQRLETLTRVKNGEINGLVAPVHALGTPVLSPRALPSVSLSTGLTLDPLKLSRKLTELGFHRQSLVEEAGDFARRGDLLDVYPESLPHPVRITYFGDEIESIEYFHPNTQSTAEERPPDPFVLTQQSEFALSSDERNQLANRLRQHDYYDEANRVEQNVQPDSPARFYGLWPRETVHVESILDDPVYGMFHPGRCWEEVQQWDHDLDQLPDGAPAFQTFRPLKPALKNLRDDRVTVFSTQPSHSPFSPDSGSSTYAEAVDVSPSLSMDARPVNEFIDIIVDYLPSSNSIIIYCGESGFKQRMQELLDDRLEQHELQTNTTIELRESPWRGSFAKAGTLVISLDDFFNRSISRGQIGSASQKTEYLSSFEELEPGDLVVHEQFGIGRFKGLNRVSTQKQTRDGLLIDYRGEDRLFIPPDQIAFVQKYIADSGYEPELSSLTSNRWDRVKKRVKEDVDELAEDLLELYMAREDTTSEPFPSDTLEQKQFEASFPHRETPDQKRAIEETKQDMKKSTPMNRLICGDSGFGKTEVALRAAFKAATDGRQVAMLVPTTVLARQHYETFHQRFSFFPYNVEMLSRFQTDSEQQEIIEDLSSGDVDVVIGTHRLLSDDIEFDNLGLLVVDEEQRFGVRQKEKLKMYRENLDVLTLTATPIPRTMYMSLSGIQDISQINTPPEDRVAIDIEVGPFNADRAKEAIQRELARGGQVFWVYNRVKDMDRRLEYVRSLVPDATVKKAHGQMSREELKRRMDNFYAGEIDVLVCTTIIEAGLDCPTVNTMIIQNSHKFGLAQLYQLRGRVGRSHEQAHALLFYPQTTT
ncbi:MAG: DEAD/DEAH box helicase, partial [bacterium]